MLHDEAPTSLGKKGFSFRSIDEILKSPPSKTPWLVDHLLPQVGTSCATAKPKVGKTTFALNMLSKIEKDNHLIARHFRVVSLFVALEFNPELMREVFEKLSEEAQKNIKIHTANVPFDRIDSLRECILKEKPVIVVIDTLQKVLGFDDLNDYAKVTSALQPYADLAKELNIHTLYPPCEQRGASLRFHVRYTALRGFFDSDILLNEEWKSNG